MANQSSQVPDGRPARWLSPTFGARLVDGLDIWRISDPLFAVSPRAKLLIHRRLLTHILRQPTIAVVHQPSPALRRTLLLRRTSAYLWLCLCGVEKLLRRLSAEIAELAPAAQQMLRRDGTTAIAYGVFDFVDAKAPVAPARRKSVYDFGKSAGWHSGPKTRMNACPQFSTLLIRINNRMALRFRISGLTASLKPASSKSASQRSGVISG
jgi:hypothetical protein